MNMQRPSGRGRPAGGCEDNKWKPVFLDCPSLCLDFELWNQKLQSDCLTGKTCSAETGHTVVFFQLTDYIPLQIFSYPICCRKILTLWVTEKLIKIVCNYFFVPFLSNQLVLKSSTLGWSPCRKPSVNLDIVMSCASCLSCPVLPESYLPLCHWSCFPHVHQPCLVVCPALDCSHLCSLFLSSETVLVSLSAANKNMHLCSTSPTSHPVVLTDIHNSHIEAINPTESLKWAVRCWQRVAYFKAMAHVAKATALERTWRSESVIAGKGGRGCWLWWGSIAQYKWPQRECAPTIWCGGWNG